MSYSDDEEVEDDGPALEPGGGELSDADHQEPGDSPGGGGG